MLFCYPRWYLRLIRWTCVYVGFSTANGSFKPHMMMMMMMMIMMVATMMILMMTIMIIVVILIEWPRFLILPELWQLAESQESRKCRQVLIRYRKHRDANLWRSQIWRYILGPAHLPQPNSPMRPSSSLKISFLI